MSSFDNASWHSGDGGFPEGLPEENGATHIGMFVAWLIHHNLESEWLDSEFSSQLTAVRSRSITGRDFLLLNCDGKFFSEMIKEGAQEFVEKYYKSRQGYLKDYRSALVRDLSSDYHVQDSWENYEVIAQNISRRYEHWLKKRGKGAWWMFWRK